MRKLLQYFASRRALLFLFAFTIIIVRVLGYLANQDVVYVRYETALISFVFMCILLTDGVRYGRKRRSVEQVQERIELIPRELPEPIDALSADYDAVVRMLSEDCKRLRTTRRAESEEQREYYTLWVHQIKTPISAIRLLLAEQDDERAALLRQELFKVEQYADLALKFVKLSDVASDLVIERCDLNEIAHAAVKKYSLLFVYRKLSVKIEPLATDVPSDSMWLGFMLGQLLSNAVKYTKTGGVRIYMDGGALVVEDTGIGIRREDLPRIFEKGYTGYNGRIDNRASGIGLYLVKRTANVLNIQVSVESELGIGTRVRMTFPKRDEFMQM
jgi:signal transduction histidine kinase